MRVRLWGAWVVERIYWHRIAVVGISAFLCGYLANDLGDQQRVDAAPQNVRGSWNVPDGPVEWQEFPDPVGPVLVASHQGVVQQAGGTWRALTNTQAYDVLRSPGGDLFVSERYQDRVVRLSPAGERLLEILADGPVDCELAADGTLVIVQNGSREIVGVNASSGDVLWRLGGFSNHYDVSLTPDGGFFVADSGNGRVLRYDSGRTLVAEFDGLGFPNTVEALPNGNVLVTTYHAGGVLELDGWTGALRSQFDVGGTVFRAVRQADGSTLVFEGERGGESLLHVYDANGARVSSRETPRGTDFEPAR